MKSALMFNGSKSSESSSINVRNGHFLFWETFASDGVAYFKVLDEVFRLPLIAKFTLASY